MNCLPIVMDQCAMMVAYRGMCIQHIFKSCSTCLTSKIEGAAGWIFHYKRLTG